MNPHTPLPHPLAGPPPPKRRRRWWVIGLWVFGSLAGLAAVLFVSAILYWNHLVKTYTSTTPKPVPPIEAGAEQFDDLKARWDAYAMLFIRRSQPIPPFELTSEELTLFTQRFGPFKKQAYAEILPERIRFQFSLSLDNSGNESLRGRYLNGIATFSPTYTNGHLNLRMASVEANGKPLPGWLQRRLGRANWGDAFNHRPEFDLAIRALDRIELQQGRLILHPMAAPAGR